MLLSRGYIITLHICTKHYFQLNESPTGISQETCHNGQLAHKVPNGQSGHNTGDHHRILPHSLTHTARRTLPQPPAPNSHLPLKPPTSINSYGLSDFFSRTNRDFDWIWHNLVINKVICIIIWCFVHCKIFRLWKKHVVNAVTRIKKHKQ